MTAGSGPWLASEAPSEGDKRHAPATMRNRDAIVEVLQRTLPEHGLVLEIASGSGEHIIHFAETFPALRWQPSDPDPAALRSIAAWAAEAGRENIEAPLLIDASAEDWPVERADALLCINMVHISPWAATLGLLRAAGRLLQAGGALYVETAESNLAFDQSLRARNPDWGIRAVEDVAGAAKAEGLSLAEIVPMPANNLSLIFRRDLHPG